MKQLGCPAVQHVSTDLHIAEGAWNRGDGRWKEVRLRMDDITILDN